ncbi:Uncharacterized protein TCM_023784 [Theobroma cacao]|uniref:CCHC-type domain-containing protein n=1 Tax=Theobroma cacao TaxID=3641 RepID=A0A061EV95_THECC|nr:Uncharacterized protein TCM_023784 [Theobroma cacao]
MSSKTQYLFVRDLEILWTRLRERYDHTKTVILPQAQYDWQHLKLQSNLRPYHGKGKKPVKKHDTSICHRCGMSRHYSRTCRTPKHFVDLYQASLKDKGKRIKTHAIENSTALTNVETNNASVKMTRLAFVEVRTFLEVSDLFKTLIAKIRHQNDKKQPRLRI